jgi:hypothetical protein
VELNRMPEIVGPALEGDAREAFLFVSDTLLPREYGWKFCQPFALDPQPICRGVTASGYFTWRRGGTQPFGTAQ